jgi:hypothetical protein
MSPRRLLRFGGGFFSIGGEIGFDQDGLLPLSLVVDLAEVQLDFFPDPVRVVGAVGARQDSRVRHVEAESRRCALQRSLAAAIISAWMASTLRSV